MENRNVHPLERLLHDMAALGSSPAGPSAEERLAAELGDDLLAVILAELNHPDAGEVPLGRRPRRAA